MSSHRHLARKNDECTAHRMGQWVTFFWLPAKSPALATSSATRSPHIVALFWLLPILYWLNIVEKLWCWTNDVGLYSSIRDCNLAPGHQVGHQFGLKVSNVAGEWKADHLAPAANLVLDKSGDFCSLSKYVEVQDLLDAFDGCFWWWLMFWNFEFHSFPFM